jgi:hypothetical protein
MHSNFNLGNKITNKFASPYISLDPTKNLLSNQLWGASTLVKTELLSKMLLHCVTLTSSVHARALTHTHTKVEALIPN